jgi:sporulation protein YlmC with PRC-barrel domain
MLKTSRIASAALACCLAATGVSICQAAAPAEREVVREGRGSHALRAKSVLGSKVSIEGGVNIGTVEDIIFDNDGSIDYLVVLNEGKFVTVPWEAAKFDFDKRTANVEITQERFREIPTYTQETAPSYYEPAYRQKVYTYYGVKPRRDVRIEKREEKRDR